MARVLLLFGGRSAEHEISCSSAGTIYDALVSVGHHVIPVGIDRDGAWFLSDTSRRPLRAEGRAVDLLVPEGKLRAGADEIGVDIVFPVLHGPAGEDGTVQGLSEMCGLPYAGCGILGSAVAMDKSMAKTIVSASGIRTSGWVSVSREEWDVDLASVTASVSKELSYPVFVKPNSLGSSIGISKVSAEIDLKDAMADAFRYDDDVLIEAAVDGREIEVGVLDGPRTSLPGEAIVESGWYTYDAKYEDDTSRFVCPADIPDEATAAVQNLAMQVFDALDLNGLARIDFFYERASGNFLFNEANTMPGFVSISGFPKMWVASGMTYAGICETLVDAALRRHDDRSSRSVR